MRAKLQFKDLSCTFDKISLILCALCAFVVF